MHVADADAALERERERERERRERREERNPPPSQIGRAREDLMWERSVSRQRQPQQQRQQHGLGHSRVYNLRSDYLLSFVVVTGFDPAYSNVQQRRGRNNGHISFSFSVPYTHSVPCVSLYPPPLPARIYTYKASSVTCV